VNPPPFRFRLERVRALRERHEDLAKEALAASLSHRMRGEALLGAAAADLEAARGDTRSLGGRAVSITDFAGAQAYLERTQMAHHAAAMDLGRREQAVAERRAALQVAARDRQILERLRERHHEDYRREALRLEGTLLDDVTSARHGRAEAA
jgi:flagellar FliJ protein